MSTTKLSAAINSDRPLSYYTYTSTLPVIIIIAIMLLTPLKGLPLVILSLLGALVGFVGLGHLLYETTLDVAGLPEYKLPVWSVLYLVAYLITTFTFLYFALHMYAPGRFFSGFSANPKEAFLDSLYISLCAYVGRPPEAVFTLDTQSLRFLSVGESILSMFLNVVIITKFVSAF